ncbi:MAG TPA: glycoside hydrolase family 3 C-terminal domain-containing protein [Terriglobales bacterium]|nr:glycoside hydrolase family 3 C-terminal domain-containing protein [Terriglobales bacterium]
MRRNKAILFAIACLVFCQTVVAQQASQPTSQQPTSQQPLTGAVYQNPQLPTAQRVDDLISHMTLDEKVSQLTHTADAIPRLGVPQYNWWNEGLHGVARAGYATVFPQAIGMAATFDEPLMHKIASAISTEFRAKYYANMRPDGSTDWYYGLTVWSPNINIFRDPRWGRGQETYGEDPFLTSRLGVAFVEGLQGNDPKYLKTVATPKHFGVHSGPEPTRHTVDVKASRHDMEDTYFPAFRATVMEGKAESVMCAYNSINGEPACANKDLLQQHLRGAWRFNGYVVSDCGAVTDVFEGHHFTKTMEEGSAAAFKTGTDLICSYPPDHAGFERDALLKAVHEGFLSESDLDRSLQRLFTARFKLGMFDPQSMVPFSSIKPEENDSEAHRQLALQTARESIVLLKNKGNLLPLKTNYKTIAVVGPNADSVDALVGNYNGTPSKPVTILDGIRKRFPQTKVVYVEGTGLVGPVTKPVPSDALYTDDSRKEHGLTGDYFANRDLQGEPVLSRTDHSVDFAWSNKGVTPKLLENYSVRWTGVLVPPEDGNYLLGFTGQDGYRLWLDGKLLVEDWTLHHPPSTNTAVVSLKKGQAYSIKIEYFQSIRFSDAHLVWNMPGHDEQDAVDAARKADLVVAVFGLSAHVEGEEMRVHADGFAGGDRTKIELPAPQKELLEKVAAAGKPTVLLLVNGSALAVNWADEHVPAIVEAWYPGEEGGTAVAEALAGDFSPSGRLPVTFYKSESQLPSFEDYSMANRTYRYFTGEPLYPFGYGLSYTSFAYSNAKVENGNVISADVANTGMMAGDEVVQLYLTHGGIAGAPLRSLEGFQHVHLEPGQKQTVTFTLNDRQLSVVDEAGNRRVMPGNVDVWIGGGQPVSRTGLEKAAGVETHFTITKEATLPE